jgi:hypothetical protein
MKSNGTAVNQRHHKRALTPAQQNALDLLASGKTDKEVSQALNLSRGQIEKWRQFDPIFQAALNRQRSELWAVSQDRLRSLIPKALDALVEVMEDKDNPNRLKAASTILRLAQLPPGSGGIGATDPEDIVRRRVKQQREQTPGMLDDLADQGKNLPSFARHMEQTWQELEARAMEPDESDTPS